MVFWRKMDRYRPGLLLSGDIKFWGYIYSVFKEHTETGKPILQPIILKYWQDQRYRRHYDNFMLGEALLGYSNN
jgi:hypothetical protein